jgi:hypothetical protein
MVLRFITVMLGVDGITNMDGMTNMDGITNKNPSNSMNNIHLLRKYAAVDLCSNIN